MKISRKLYWTEHTVTLAPYNTHKFYSLVCTCTLYIVYTCKLNYTRWKTSLTQGCFDIIHTHTAKCLGHILYVLRLAWSSIISTFHLTHTHTYTWFCTCIYAPAIGFGRFVLLLLLLVTFTLLKCYCCGLFSFRIHSSNIKNGCGRHIYSAKWILISPYGKAAQTDTLAL